MPPIRIYTLSTCSHCKHTKQFLNELGVHYNYIDVDLLQGEERSSIIEEMRSFNPNLSFPTIIIGNQIIIGFKENEIRGALGL